MGASEDIAKIAEQEATLVFPAFDEATAFAIGSAIRERGLKDKAADHRRYPHVGTGRCSMRRCRARPPTTPNWARRKRNVVQRFLKSTYRMVLEQQRPDRTFKPGSGLDSADYVLAGGGFPVTVKGAGVIGVIAVSGLPEREDHGIVVAICASIWDWTRGAGAGAGRESVELRQSASERRITSASVPPRSTRVEQQDARTSTPKPSSPRSSRRRSPPPSPSSPSASICPKGPRAAPIVVGAGKGSAQMAAALEKAWDGPLDGVVVTRYGYAAPCRRIHVIEAAHPVPDAAGLAASRMLLDTGRGPRRRRSGHRADLRRRLGAAAVAAGGADARRRDRRQRGAACLRRADLGDEHGAQACLDDQGRAARRGRLAGQGRVAGRLRHSRRQSGAGRLRARPFPTAPAAPTRWRSSTPTA